MECVQPGTAGVRRSSQVSSRMRRIFCFRVRSGRSCRKAEVVSTEQRLRRTDQGTGHFRELSRRYSGKKQLPVDFKAGFIICRMLRNLLMMKMTSCSGEEVPESSWCCVMGQNFKLLFLQKNSDRSFPAGLFCHMKTLFNPTNI